MIRCSYRDSRYGQLHLRENAPAAGAALLCLHATAYSSRSLVALLGALDGRRHAIAPDTPGFGESDGPAEQPTIADYADALAEAFPEPVDLLGYHTGVSIAVELAIRHPARVGRLWLMGVPYFQALDFEAWRAKLAGKHQLGERLDQFDERWDFLVAQRPAGVTLERGFANFVDELKAWPNGWWAHDALFRHDLAERLPLVGQPVTVLNPAGHLAEPSRLAAALLPGTEVIELPDLEGAVLDRYPDRLAELIAPLEPVRTSAAGSGRRRNNAETAA